MKIRNGPLSCLNLAVTGNPTTPRMTIAVQIRTAITHSFVTSLDFPGHLGKFRVRSAITKVESATTMSPELMIRPWRVQRSQQLDHILSLFQTASDHSQLANEAIITAWSYLLEEKLWISRYPTLAALQTAIHFDQVIKPVLNQSQGFFPLVLSDFSEQFIVIGILSPTTLFL